MIIAPGNAARPWCGMYRSDTSHIASRIGQGTIRRRSAGQTGPGLTEDMAASLAWQPTDAFRLLLSYTKSYLLRNDTGRVAFDQRITSLQSTYHFSRFTFARARADYDTVQTNLHGQLLFGWEPSPGTTLYVGYNDDLNRNGYSPFTGLYEPGLRRNQRTFFIKMSYLFRLSV